VFGCDLGVSLRKKIVGELVCDDIRSPYQPVEGDDMTFFLFWCDEAMNHLVLLTLKNVNRPTHNLVLETFFFQRVYPM